MKKICISLADLPYEACLEIVRTVEFAEVRLDLLELSDTQIETLFTANGNMIATCRPGKYDDETRWRVLLCAIESGAAYLDIEMESADSLKHDLIEAARAKGCGVIVSYHNFEKTPKRAELDHIIRWCAEVNPDVVKIACMAQSARDNARLLGLLDSELPLIVVGMGEQGKLTRIAAPLLGGFCTFAAHSSEKTTAPGQLTQHELETLLTSLQQI